MRNRITKNNITSKLRMAKFNIGDRVINVNSREKGVVIDILIGGRGRQLYRIRYGNDEKDTLENNLIQDTNITDPFECCKQGLFGSYLDFSRINTTLKINNTSNNTISSLKASRTIFKAYQFKPLLKFLNSSNRRLLIADEVGLGKTIEAGHIMMELASRKELRNVLIICPKMLREKWKTELKEKFNFYFKIYDSKKELANELSHGVVKGIVNYEAIRSSEKNKKETNPILQALEEQNIKFDFILCDEAHRLRNKRTQTYKGAEILIPFSTSAVFLTATPIMISEENLYNLLHLLDNQQFNKREIFQTYLSINKPFITAISQLNKNIPFQQIVETLKSSVLYIHYGENNEYRKQTTVEEMFKEIPLYEKIIFDLTTQPDSIDNRVQLQFNISSMSMMNNIFSRTRKREVTTDWTQPVREPYPVKVKLYEDEKEEFDNVLNSYIDEHTVYVDEYGDAKMSQGHVLGLIQKKRRVASSVYGYLNKNLDEDIDTYEMYPDAKFDALKTILREVVTKNKKKLIVFALFKNTLKYLNIRLQKVGFKPIVIHGDIKDRDDIINKFRTDKSVDILLSSEVGSEGIDLQFCDALVNYDLPWNPMVVEQRIGRIDRFGQKSQIVNIYNLIVQDSIQEEIFDRLLDRIGIFRSCIGDLEAILDKETADGKTLQQRFIQLEKEIYCQDLTEEARQKKIDSIAVAIEVEKRHLEEINEGLTDTLTNDTYFRNEIEKIQNNYRYITDKELFNYLHSIITNELTECLLSEEEKSIFNFKIPLYNKNYLINFLNEYNINNDLETDLLFKRFINTIRGVSEFKLTFNQEIAYSKPNLIFVNAYHPLILATKEFFKQKFEQVNRAFQFSIDKKHLADLEEIRCGEYFLAVYTIYLTKRWFGSESINELIMPLLFDIQSDKIIACKDITERFLGEAQLYATANHVPYTPEIKLIENLRGDFAEQIDIVYTNYIEDQQMRLDTSKTLQIQQTEEFYNNRIKKLEQSLADLEYRSNYSDSEEERIRIRRILPAQKGLLHNLVAEKEDSIAKIQGSTLNAKEPRLLSLSQIKVH